MLQIMKSYCQKRHLSDLNVNVTSKSNALDMLKQSDRILSLGDIARQTTTSLAQISCFLALTVSYMSTI